MRDSFKAIAQRLHNARESFGASLVELAGITDAQANDVIDLYLREKVAKLDVAIGTINVKHGAYLEPDVIRRAVSMAGNH